MHITLIIAIMIMMIKKILIIAAVIIINRPFEPGDFFTGSTTGSKSSSSSLDCPNVTFSAP